MHGRNLEKGRQPLGVVAALPKSLNLEGNGQIVSLVLPAESCNLGCRWCFINGRKEVIRSEKFLTEFNYLSFIRSLKEDENIDLVALQGYEPLMDSCWSYTESVLNLTERLNISTSISTNGVELKRRAQYLSSKPIEYISVSLDSSIAEEHDQSRSTSGAFAKTVAGIKEALSYPSLKNKVSVISVIQPGQEKRLLGMPKLLKSLGVTQWVVSPLLNVGQKNFGSKVITSDFTHYLNQFYALAKEENIQFFLDDELGNLTSDKVIPDYIAVRTIDNPNRLIRLAPNGQVSLGKSILTQQPDVNWDAENTPAKQVILDLLPSHQSS